MDELARAGNTQDAAVLIRRYYDIPEVQGFALGVHGNFVSLFRAAYGRRYSVSDILKDGRTPTSWQQICAASGLITLSPIYVVIYVTLSEHDFRSKFQPPDFINTDQLVLVEKIDPFKGLADRARHRPSIMGGISVSNSSSTVAGTLGSFVQNTSQQDVYILSCSHVLSSHQGSAVIQQGTSDGGHAPTDTIGATAYEVPLVAGTGFSFGSQYNSVDAALAKLNGAASPSSHIRTLGRVTSMLPKSSLGIGDDVVFVGKESDSQDCRIHRYIARLKVDIDGTTYNFGDVFEVEPRLRIYFGSLTKNGDSGAWIVRYRSGLPDELCGLLFAGNDTGPNKDKAIGCFIDNVKGELASIAGFSFSLL